MPPTPASTGSRTRRRSRRSPTSKARRASSPMTRKKKVIRPLLTHPRRSCPSPNAPNRNSRGVCHNAWYDFGSIATQPIATTAANSSNTLLPVSVRTNPRKGVRCEPDQGVVLDRGNALMECPELAGRPHVPRRLLYQRTHGPYQPPWQLG